MPAKKFDEDMEREIKQLVSFVVPSDRDIFDRRLRACIRCKTITYQGMTIKTRPYTVVNRTRWHRIRGPVHIPSGFNGDNLIKTLKRLSKATQP